MPHGGVTPLARQLRAVLLALQPRYRTILYSPLFLIHLQSRSSAPLRLLTSLPAAALAPRDEDLDHHGASDTARLAKVVSRRKRTRRDYITEALTAPEHQQIVPRRYPHKPDLSHVSAKRRDGLAKLRQNVQRRASNPNAAPVQTDDMSLERITARYIQHMQINSDPAQSDWNAAFRLTHAETLYLQRKGYDLEDVQEWARIITSTDSNDATCALSDRLRTHGHRAIPFSIFLYILRRPYLKPEALRRIVDVAPKLLIDRLKAGSTAILAQNMIFFVRVLRHAREVWPASIEYVTQLFLRHLPDVRSAKGVLRQNQFESLTHMLNRAMHLISLDTAVHPFRDVVHQEAAIVRILQFMTEHDPPFQLNREGYRAVVRVQLAQQKTDDERQWAELKALSWPPWKQERTAMDADITPEVHGTSRAANTLRRMYEAGYGPLNWEKVAQLYSGWDLDGTPTIQTRVLLGDVRQFVPAIWTARIATTRTAQEAWAAYLAFEDTNAKPTSDVFLAILKRLYGEEQRQRQQRVANEIQSAGNDQYERVLPGDRREVDPLPPSTHLYTYVRRPVPTVEEFFHQLGERRLVLKLDCLSFLVANAASMQQGLLYLRFCEKKYPSIQHLLTYHPTSEVKSVPSPLFNAYIDFLCKCSNVSLDKMLGPYTQLIDRTQSPPLLQGEKLNLKHSLVHAIELIRLRQPIARPPWNHVLRALCRKASLPSMRFLYHNTQTTLEQNMPAIYEEGRGAMLAYRLIRRLLSMMQDVSLVLDESGFYPICLAMENMSFASWRMLKEDINNVPHISPKMPPSKTREYVREAVDLLRSSNHSARLKGLFETLTGHVEGSSNILGADTNAQHHHFPPRLLVVPDPALLHAYIRALGWMGDHHGLLSLTRWMVEFREALMEQQGAYRNGDMLMRRAIVALRVFLERAWLRGVWCSARQDGGENPDRRLKILQRLERPAEDNIRLEVERLVEGVEEWCGWPDDEEVEEYCRHHSHREIRLMYKEAGGTE